MPPSRLGVQARSPVRQTSGQIQVFVSKFEPGLGLIGIEGCDLAELHSRASKVFLTQVIQSHRLMRISVGRIELQCMLQERAGLFWRAKFEVIHSDNHVEGKQVWPFAQSLLQLADRQVVLQESLVSEAQVNLSLE